MLQYSCITLLKIQAAVTGLLLMAPGALAEGETCGKLNPRLMTCGRTPAQANVQKGKSMTEKIKKSDEEWRKQLTAQQFEVARKKGTEYAFTGEYYNNHRTGVYHCVCCGAELFTSDTKYDSGSGWPSFWAPSKKENIAEHEDRSHGMRRIEITCTKCDAHLGHVFEDGPEPTNLRYCVNSASLKFEEKK